MSQIINRRGYLPVDSSAVESLSWNDKTGSRKTSEVGRALLPLPNGASGFTTNATSPTILPSAGVNLAVYNNSTSVHAVTIGDSTMTPQAAGAVQSGATAPFVGIACPPNAWTYVAAAQWNWVAADSAALLVYIIDDNTYMLAQPHNNAST